MRILSLLLACSCLLPGQTPDLLPGAAKLDFPADMAAVQYAELRAFYERQIADAAAKRRVYWTPEKADENRRELRKTIGAIDPLMDPKPKVTSLGEGGGVRASLVEWPISRIGTIGPTMGGTNTVVRLYGIQLEPIAGGPHPAALLIPDATENAADVTGLTARLLETRQTGRLLAQKGFVVFAPFFVQRRAFCQPWLEDRQWLVRLAYQTGRHLIGGEVLQVLNVAGYLATLPNVDAKRIAVAGSGQGGFTALLAAALDSRFAAAVSNGYRSDPLPDWEQPEDRILWRYRSRFGNPELARLAGAGLILDKDIVQSLEERLKPVAASTDSSWPLRMDLEQVARVANAQFAQWQAFYRNMALESNYTRAARWTPDYSSTAAYERSMKPKLEAYYDQIGRYPPAEGPLDSRSLKLYDEPGFTGHRLTVRVYDGVEAYGILLVPKGLRPGERRPVVFVQHGLGGRPEDSLGVVENPRADAVYSRFGLRLAERGYVVFAPMIATQDNAERTKLIRRCHLVGMIPAGMDVVKFNRVMDYLETLPFVDRERFSFYGLSYGGYTALWTGPGCPRFKAVISSGHFNDWQTKTVDLTLGTAFPLYFNVFDQYNFGLLNGFNHAGLASIIAPRAFMVEIGDKDSVVIEPRTSVDAECEAVVEIYRKLGIPRKGRIARFNGPHQIDGREAYPFLDEILGWRPAQ